MFPGQGSQRLGMGAGLFDEIQEFRSIEDRIDALLGYSVRDLCLNDPTGKLSDTKYTQPALYIVNALHYFKAVSQGLKADVVLGHSLGEYNALLAAGAFDFITGLRLVARRGELMSQARHGGMMAVLQLDALGIAACLTAQQLSTIDIASYNSPRQTVISGPEDDLRRAEPLLLAAGAKACAKLPVSAAFHSRYMASAAHAFDEFLADVPFGPLRLEVMASATSAPYRTADGEDAIRRLLVRQIRESVKWTQCIRRLIEAGASDFTEMGPGNVLTRLLDEIRASMPRTRPA